MAKLEAGLRLVAAFAYLLSQLAAITRAVLLPGIGLSLVLIVHPQGQDLLRAASESVGLSASLGIAGALLALSGWYWAQKTLVPFGDRLADSPWPGALPEGCRRDAEDWYPRIAGVLPLAGAALGAALISAWILAAWLVALAAAIAVALWKRRTWLAGRGFAIEVAPSAERTADLRHFLRDPRFRITRRILLAGFVAGALFANALIPLVLAQAPLALGAIGPAAVAFLWLATMIPLLSVLAAIGSRWRVPALTFALAVPAMIATQSPGLYAPCVAAWAEPPPGPAAPSAAETLECVHAEAAAGMGRLPAYACRWAQQRIVARGPARPAELTVFVYAAEGGGIRAALWTALVLGRLAEGQPAAIADAFAMSGVSGGSLGLAAFAARRAEHLAGCPAADPPGFAYAKPLGDAMANDFLSPTLAAYLFNDLLRPLLRWPGEDRAAALEGAWRAAMQGAKATATDRFGAPFDALWATACPTRLPLLFLNATQVHDGSRAIVAPSVALGPLSTRGEALAGFDQAVDLGRLAARGGQALTLASAASLSARFPYVTPVATAIDSKGALREFADGGYADNSGALTLADALTALPLSVGGVRLRPIAVQITNDDAPVAAPAPGAPGTAQALAPLVGFMASWRADILGGRIALAELAEARGGRFVQVDLPLSAQLVVPVGWTLADATVKHVTDSAARFAPAGAGAPSAADPLPAAWTCLARAARGEPLAPADCAPRRPSQTRP